MTRRLTADDLARVARTPAQRRAAERARGVETPAPTRKAKRRGEMNEWERAFAKEYLGRLDDPCRIYEAIRLRVGVGCWYTPDFVEGADVYCGGGLIAYEVKGRREGRGRDGMVRLKAAAQQYPEIIFWLAEGGPGKWCVTRVG